MLETKYESEFIVINHDKEKEYLETIWKEVNYMTNEEVMNELRELIATTSKYMPKYNLTDESKKSFGYSTKLQAEMAKYLQENLNSHPELKSAVIISNDLIAQLSLEQLDDEGQSQRNLEGMNFFTSREDALAWLFA